MTAASTTSSAGGSGLASVLGIVFIVLKLTHVIDWSWWWVLAPFWITTALAAVVVLVGLIYVSASKSSRRRAYRRNR